MAAKITDIDVFVLRAPDSGRAHWVSHFVVPRANETHEILIRAIPNAQDNVVSFNNCNLFTNDRR